MAPQNPEPFVEEYLKKAKLFQVRHARVRPVYASRTLRMMEQATLSLDKALEHSNVIYILVATPTGCVTPATHACTIY